MARTRHKYSQAQVKAGAEIERRRREGHGRQLLEAEVDAVDWIERNFYIARPRDPVTAKLLGNEGLIRIIPYQKEILREAIRQVDGRYVYATVVWSEPKKHAKSTLAAAIGLHRAYSVPYSQIYCLANDGRQSRDREFLFMSRAIKISKQKGGVLANLTTRQFRIELPNRSVIEPVAVDPSGEAGGEPSLSIWGEIHGYRQAAKLKLWAEMTIPPTLYGQAQRWVESYAGYEGESPILEMLYATGVEEGVPHPTLTDCYVNEEAQQFTFWSHVGRFGWHTEEYYAQERKALGDYEFLRLHKNQWISSKASFLTKEEWKACYDDQLPPLSEHEPCIIALDASISGDCFAIVVVTRHPFRPNTFAARLTIILDPKIIGRINYRTEIEPIIEELWEKYNIMAWVYDPWQLHKLGTDMADAQRGLWLEFPQGKLRLAADTALRQLAWDGEIAHGNDKGLNTHVQNSAAKAAGTAGKMIRIVKKTDAKKIDACVALSMGVFVLTLVQEHGPQVLYADEIRVTMGY